MADGGGADVGFASVEGRRFPFDVGLSGGGGERETLAEGGGADVGLASVEGREVLYDVGSTVLWRREEAPCANDLLSFHSSADTVSL